MLTITPQTFGQHCGSVALLDLGIALGLWGSTTVLDAIELFLNLLPFQLHFGGGAMDEAAVLQWLESFLPSKGVPEAHALDRAKSAVKKLGVDPIQLAIRNKDPWRALKGLGNQLGKPFQWITFDELRSHVADREQTKFGTNGQKKQSKPKKQVLTLALSPETLTLFPTTFEDDSGDHVQLISFQEMVANARGACIATVDQAKALCAAQASISTDALAVVTIGEVADVSGCSTTHLQWPALYTPTNEPVFVKGTLVNLGDACISLSAHDDAPAVSTVSSVVLRSQSTVTCFRRIGNF